MIPLPPRSFQNQQLDPLDGSSLVTKVEMQMEREEEAVVVVAAAEEEEEEEEEEEAQVFEWSRLNLLDLLSWSRNCPSITRRR